MAGDDVKSNLDELERKLGRLEAQLRGAPAPQTPVDPPVADPDGLLLDAQRRVERLSGRIDELLGVRDQLQRAVSELVGEYERMVAALAAEPRLEEIEQEGDVELHAGPFADIAALAALEHALRRLPGVEHAAVRRFDGGAAVLDVRLIEPTALARELHAGFPRAFSVASAETGALVIELRHAPAARPG